MTWSKKFEKSFLTVEIEVLGGVGMNLSPRPRIIASSFVGEKVEDKL